MGRSGLFSQLGYAEEVYVDELQTITITGTPTGGTFTLAFEGALTAAIAFDAAAAAVKAALELLETIDVVTVGGGPFPGTAITVEFTGPQVAGRNVPLLVADSTGLTGGASPTVTPAETTPGTGYGDFVVPDRFLEHDSEALKLVLGQRRSSALRAGNTVLRTDRTSIIRKGIEGPVVHELANKGQGRLFRHCIGPAVITTPNGGTLSRDHTHTPALLFNQSLTVQAGRPDVNDTTQPFSYLGCKVTEWEISQELDDEAMISLSFDGFDETLAQALAVAAYPAAQGLFDDEMLQVTVGGAQLAFTTAKVKGNNALKTDRHFLRGETKKKQPLRAGMQTFEGQLAGEFESLVAYNRFVNGSIVPVVYEWTHDLEIEASFPFKLTITMPACRFTGETPAVADAGVLAQPMPFEILNNGTDPVMTLVYRTSDTVS